MEFEKRVPRILEHGRRGERVGGWLKLPDYKRNLNSSPNTRFLEIYITFDL
jgi:hypothetical protein